MNAPETIARPLAFAALPPLGAALDGGIFAGLSTDKQGQHHAVCLLPDKPAKALPWQKAQDWAAGIGATLPTRPVAALLFANCKREFTPEWHWTCEAFDRSYAWFQSFNDGNQSNGHKSYGGQARAVRLIQLTA